MSYSSHILEHFPTLRYLDCESETDNFDFILSASFDSISAVARVAPIRFGGEELSVDVFHCYFHTLRCVRMCAANQTEISLVDAAVLAQNFHYYIYKIGSCKVYFFETYISSSQYQGDVIFPGIENPTLPTLQTQSALVITDCVADLKTLPLPQSVLKMLFMLKDRFGAYVEEVAAPRIRRSLCVSSAVEGSHLCDEKPRAQGVDFHFSLASVQVDMKQLISYIRAELEDKLSESSLTLVLSLASNFLCVYNYPSMLSITNCIINVLNSFGVASALCEKLLALCTNHLRNLVSLCEQKPHAQGFDAEQVASVGPILLSLLSVVTLSKLPNASLLSKALKVASDLGRACSGIASFFTFVPKICLHLFDVFHVWLYGVPRDMTQFEQFENAAVKVFSEITMLSKVDNIENLRKDAKLRKKVRDLKFRAHLVYANLLKIKVSHQTLSVYRTYLHQIDEIAKKAEIHGGCDRGARPEPACVMFAGATGMGKSRIPLYLAADVLACENEGKPLAYNDVIDEVYVRNAAQKFYNGYRGQTVFVYDDFGQMRDSQTNPNEEFLEVIKSQNFFEYPLHMADLLEKNNSFFVSKMIILTTNTMNPNIQSLTCPHAFNRRIHLRYEVKVRGDCLGADGIFDPAAAELRFGTDTFKAWEFVPYVEDFARPGTYVPSGRTLSFEQMRSEVIGKYLAQLEHSDRSLQNLGSYMTFIRDNPIRSLAKAQVCLTPIERLATEWWTTGRVTAKAGDDVDLEEVVAFFESGNERTLFELLDRCAERRALDMELEWDDFDPEQTYMEYVDSPRVELQPSLSFLDEVKRQMSDLWESFNYKTIFRLVALAGSLVGGLYLLKKMFVPTVEEETPYAKVLNNRPPHVDLSQAEANPSGDVSTKVVSRPKVEANPSGDVVSKAVSRPRVEAQESLSPIPAFYKSDVAAQAYLDPNTMEILSNRIAGNIYRIAVRGPNQASWRVLANGVFITSRCFLMNAHVVTTMRDYDELRLENRNQSALPPIDLREKPSALSFYPVVGADGEQKDATIVVFPRSYPAHRTITQHFASSAEMSCFNRCPAMLVGYKTMNNAPCYYTCAVDAVASDGLDFEYRNSLVRIRRHYAYNSTTTVGDCGSLLLANEPKLARKILGFHVAGMTGRGYATALSEQDLVRTLERIDPTQRITLNLPSVIDDPVRAQCALPEGEFIPLGRVARPATVPSKGDIYPSPLYDVIVEHKTLPSALKPFTNDGVLVDPLKKGIAKWGHPYGTVPRKLLDLATTDYQNVIFSNTDPAYARLLTYDECLRGTDLEFECPLKRRSSPGYKWSHLSFGSPGKTKWLGDGDTWIMDDPVLREAFLLREEKAKRGERVEHFWHDTLKVERRPIEKVREGKTRVFSIGDMDFNILFRKYFLGFIANAMAHRIDNESGIGVTPQSFEWTRLANHLRSKGNRLFDGDFSSFDGTLIPEILFAWLDVVNAWYANFSNASAEELHEQNLVRHVLMEDLVCSVHVCNNIVYMLTHGQPSGNPGTTHINTGYNSISMRIVFFMALEDLLDSPDRFVDGVKTFLSRSFPNADIDPIVDALLLAARSYRRLDHAANPVRAWRHDIVFMSYGDDNVVAVRPGCFFNQVVASCYYERIGMTYTDATKAGVSMENKALSDITFLKRGFLFDSGTWYCPLALDTILEMFQWVRGTMDQHESCAQTLEAAVEELAYHDYGTWMTWIPRIQKNLHLLEVRPSVYTFTQYRDFFYSPRRKTYSSSGDFLCDCDE